MAKKSKQEKRIEKDLLHIVGFFIFLVILFFIAREFFEGLNGFEYEGLTFSKEKFGDLAFYQYSYVTQNRDGKLFQYNLFLRKDPRLNDIEMNGHVSPFSEPTFITIDTTYLNQCTESFAAVGTLAKFLADNQIIVVSGNMDFTEAAVRDQEYVVCSNRPNKSVIQIFKSDNEKTSVDVNGTCYSINVGNDCRIMDAVEKFEVQTVLDIVAS